MITAHSWRSDSISEEVSGTTMVSYSSTENYEELQFDFPYCEFEKYENEAVVSLERNSFGYRPGMIDFFPDTSGASLLDCANIKLVTDRTLVLERHRLADSIVPVVVTYYHAK